MEQPTERSLLLDAVVIFQKLLAGLAPEDREMVERWIALTTKLLYPPKVN